MRNILRSMGSNRAAHAALAGTLLGLAFPKPEIAGLAWLAPGFLLLAAGRPEGGRTFRAGYLGGLAYWGVSLHWLLFIPVKYAPILGWLAVIAYLALYQAVWAWACWRLFPGRRAAIGQDYGGLTAELLATSRSRRAAWVLACAMLWVALEMVQARMLTGFPWNLLGASQYTVLPLVQLAGLTGVHGISFIVAWCSVALAVSALLITKRPAQRQMVLGDLVLPGAVVAAAWCWGAAQLWRKIEQPPGPHLKVALIQPGVPQTLIWDPAENDFRFKKLIALTEAALAAKPDLLVWPEAAAPGTLRYDTNLFAVVTNLAITHNTWMVIGSDDVEPDGQGGERFLNAAFLVSPTGELLDRYSKRHLVMFGEYVPLVRWLPFLKKLTPVEEGFTPGPGPRQFRFFPGLSNSIPVKAGMLICFEDIMPRLAQDSVEADTDFILNLTNDGWFRESAAQWQHAANAVFRAVETGRPLVRCTNNGRTCWVDAAGRIREAEETHHAADKEDIYAESWRIVNIPLNTATQGQLPFYHRHGDWFGWSCCALALALLAVSFLPRRAA